MDDETYTLREAGERLGVPSRTLRKYCDEGLIPHVKRKRSGYRLLNAEQMEWAKVLIKLEQCGFDKAGRRTFAKLTRKGNETLAERKAILETKKRNIWQAIEDLQENIDFIERQVEAFDQILLNEK